VTADVAVIGGGVTGLTVAHHLLRRDPSASVTVLEAGSEPGGMLRSVSVAGVRVPAGHGACLGREHWAADLSRGCGVGEELVQRRG